MNLNRILSQRADVAWKEVDGAAILMDLGSEKKVHRLNSVGSFIWSQINGSQSLEDVLDKLCIEFDVSHKEAKEDLIELISELENIGVLSGS